MENTVTELTGEWINYKNNHLEDNKEKDSVSREEITRKEALVKASKYAAFTAAGMMLILSPKESQAQSVPGSPGGTPW